MHTFKVGDRVEALLGVPQDPRTPFLIGGTISEVAHNINGQVTIAWVDWDNGRKTGHMKPQTQLILVSKDEPMTDRKNHLHELDKQRTTAREFEKYYKELRETIEAEIVTVTNRVDLAIGQVWEHSTDGNFAVILGLDCNECLVKLSSGNTYPLTKITSNRSAYTYLGKMEDVISVVSE